MRILYPFRNDTQFLLKICEGLNGGYLPATISLNESKTEIPHSTRLLLMGHGTGYGLLDSTMHDYLVKPSDAEFLQEHEVIGIWCYASKYALAYGLHGFFTSMFISDINEAEWKGVKTTEEEIERENAKFAERVNALLLEGVPLSEFPDRLREMDDVQSELTKFNYGGLCYFA